MSDVCSTRWCRGVASITLADGSRLCWKCWDAQCDEEVAKWKAGKPVKESMSEVILDAGK